MISGRLLLTNLCSENCQARVEAEPNSSLVGKHLPDVGPAEIYDKYTIIWPLTPGEGRSLHMTCLSSKFLTLTDSCHAQLTPGSKELKQGPFVFAVSFASFTSFILLIFLGAVHGIHPSSCSSVPRYGFMSYVSSKIGSYFSAL